MGNNHAYTVWEQQVIDLYNLGVLTLDVLDVISISWEDSDIDHGGSDMLETEEGFSADDVALILVKPELKEKIEQRNRMSNDDEGLDDLCDELYDEFWKISKDRWGWG